MSDRFLEQFERLMPAGSVDETVDPPVLSPPDAVSAADIVRLAAERKLSFDIVGGETYPRPASRPGTVRLSTRAMTSEPVIDTGDFVAEISAGTTIDDAVAAASAAGMEFPLDLLSGAEATVGGAFMTRAVGGPRRIGSTFPDSVLGGKFVVAAGEIVTAGGRMIKNVTGYDLTRFFAGSLGVFGIAAQLYVKLTALRETSAVLMVRVSAEGDALAVLDDLMTATAPDVIQLSAPGGLANATLLRVRYSGFAGIVETACTRAGDLAAQHDAGIDTMTEDASRALIRASVNPVFGADTVTAAAHPSAVRTVLRNIRACCPAMPLALQVKDGRFWFHPGDGDMHDGFTNAVTATGGKQPLAWADIRTSGIAGLFGDAELAILRSLKRELDPTEIFNPHLVL